MNNPRFQVFVSSTFVDLQVERQAVLKAILELGAFPAGMEMVPSAGDDQWAFIKDVIDASDYYILIVGGRYGALAPDGRSFTEKEYLYAVETGKPILAFLRENLGELEANMLEQKVQGRRKLEEFRKHLQSSRLVGFYNTPDELHHKVMQSLVNAFKSSPQEGWKRGGSDEKTGPIGAGLVEFRKTFEGLSYEELLRDSSELLVVFNDGRSWIDTHREALEERAKRRQRTKFLLLHPQSDFIPVLIRKNGKEFATEIDGGGVPFRLFTIL